MYPSGIQRINWYIKRVAMISKSEDYSAHPKGNHYDHLAMISFSMCS